jgi:cell fate regulator YaaT (PSP1 superfamily)
MGDLDKYEDSDEDISALEDNPAEEPEAAGAISGQGTKLETIAPDIPIYRVRIFYSHETVFAVYKEDTLSPGNIVVVPTRYGRDLAQVIGRISRRSIPAKQEFVWVERTATKEDLEKSKASRKPERDAFFICKEKIESRKLEMKLISVHYLLEESKILFFFTSENRVDFRELLKDLVGIFKARIELRQIGVRDEARMVGGLGVCGRGYCCHMVSDKPKAVSIKMAKDQNLSLNSMKISGPCGRLLCCLSYEHCFYNEQRRLIPQEGIKVSDGTTLWKVMEVNVVLGQLKLSAEDGRQTTLPASRFERVDNRWYIRGESRHE